MMESTFSWEDMVDEIATYLSDSDDPEFLIEMYQSMFPDTKVTYEGNSIFTVRNES